MINLILRAVKNEEQSTGSLRMDTIKTVLIGAGTMGRGHAARISAYAGAKLAAVCDTSADAAKTLAKKYGAGAYSDFDIMLKKEKPDAVFICLPPFAHGGEAEACASSGAAIFMEKPLALTLERAKSICDSVEKNKSVSMIGYHQRFGGAVKKLRELIANGAAGRPCLFDARYSCNCEGPKWWSDVNGSGGQILEQVIHTYDMAMFLMGKPSDAKAVMGNLTHKDVPGYTIEDVSAAVIRFENGALATVCATNCAVPMRWDNPFYAVFENLTADFSDYNNAVFEFTNEKPPRAVRLSFDTDAYEAEVRHFFECARAGRQTDCPLSEGLEGLKLVLRLIESAKKNID